MSGKEIFVGELPEHLYSGKKASELMNESVFLPAKESYAPLATALINFCKKTNCNSDVTKFKVRLNTLQPVANADTDAH